MTERADNTIDEEKDTEPVSRPSEHHVSASSKNEVKTSAKAAPTPMMAQYIEIKAANPDNLLFYRMGDFYELFFEDAEIASRALGITLTTRGKHLDQDIPMCGVPHHAADEYLQRLITLGHRVAVCEQMEDPKEAKKRGSKAVVRRDVVRLVTPGTLTEETLLDASSNNYFLAISEIKSQNNDRLALAWTDISTGEFLVNEIEFDSLYSELSRIEPKEIIISSHLNPKISITELEQGLNIPVAILEPSFFESSLGEKRICAYYGVKSLEGFGHFSRNEISAAAAILAYIERTQIGEQPQLRPLTQLASDGVMVIDAATRANLEIIRTLSGERKGSLISTIDETVTAPGTRLLARRLASPLADSVEINQRLASVTCFYQETNLLDENRNILKKAPDLERSLSRLSLNRGGPRDLQAIGQAIDISQKLAELIKILGDNDSLLGHIYQNLVATPQDLANDLKQALNENLPLLTRDGGFIDDDYDPDLKEQRHLREDSRQVIAALRQQYADETDIKSLKIKHNNVLGYFVEVTAGQADKLFQEPHNQQFIHRQTLANAIRFTTVTLGELEAKIAKAAERALQIELTIFDQLVEKVLGVANQVQNAASAIAELDVTSSLAYLALSKNYTCPKIDNSLSFDIKLGRHPVVEQSVAGVGQDGFIANTCDLSPLNGQIYGQVMTLTGPNMGGKSTFLRQNALIAILAQMGSYVPAERAHIGVIDQLFSRVGAADNLARGHSTFMVEMVETAGILNRATEKSLVIFDEIGRGTATFDGLSIAWATIEQIHEVIKCRTLFATHFHELTSLSVTLSRLTNATVQVKEWEGDVVFLHQVIAGAADRSYGIQVAKLAGLPDTVVQRARQILENLEKDSRQNPQHLLQDLPLFSAITENPKLDESVKNDPILDKIRSLDPDQLSPLQAIEFLYKLKADIDG